VPVGSPFLSFFLSFHCWLPLAVEERKASLLGIVSCFTLSILPSLLFPCPPGTIILLLLGIQGGSTFTPPVLQNFSPLASCFHLWLLLDNHGTLSLSSLEERPVSIWLGSECFVFFFLFFSSSCFCTVTYYFAFCHNSWLVFSISF